MKKSKPESKNETKPTTEKTFELTPSEIRTDKILAITYAVWALTNVVIFLFHFTSQQFEELFPITTLDWKYYNFFTLIIFAILLPECIKYIIKFFRIQKREKQSKK